MHPNHSSTSWYLNITERIDKRIDGTSNSVKLMIKINFDPSTQC